MNSGCFLNCIEDKMMQEESMQNKIINFYVEGPIDEQFYYRYITENIKTNILYKIKKTDKKSISDDFNKNLENANTQEIIKNKLVADLEAQLKNNNKNNVINYLLCLSNMNSLNNYSVGIIDKDIYTSAINIKAIKDINKINNNCKILYSECSDLETTLLWLQPSILYNCFSLKNNKHIVDKIIRTDYVFGKLTQRIDNFVLNELDKECLLNSFKFKDDNCFNIAMKNFFENETFNFEQYIKKTICNKKLQDKILLYLNETLLKERRNFDITSCEGKATLNFCNGHNISHFYEIIFPNDFKIMKYKLIEKERKKNRREKFFYVNKIFEFYLTLIAFTNFNSFSKTSIGSGIIDILK